MPECHTCPLCLKWQRWPQISLLNPSTTTQPLNTYCFQDREDGSASANQGLYSWDTCHRTWTPRTLVDCWTRCCNFKTIKKQIDSKLITINPITLLLDTSPLFSAGVIFEFISGIGTINCNLGWKDGISGLVLL